MRVRTEIYKHIEEKYIEGKKKKDKMEKKTNLVKHDYLCKYLEKMK